MNKETPRILPREREEMFDKILRILPSTPVHLVGEANTAVHAGRKCPQQRGEL